MAAYPVAGSDWSGNEWCSCATTQPAVLLAQAERDPQPYVGILVGRAAPQQRVRERDVVARGHVQLDSTSNDAPDACQSKKPGQVSR